MSAQTAIPGLEPVRHLYSFTSISESGRIFLSEDGQKNRAFRSKSSEAPMRFLRAFRCNPLRALNQALELPQAIPVPLIAEGN
ncbi:MAG: hypothetical protein LBK13_13985 [Spirochaetales bacterium]|nr:hypothetical protein [Spirochaetales bacterium]